jgi:hypothetical protein
MEQIILDTITLCRQEEKIDAQIVRNLIVIRNERLVQKHACDSLFTFCTRVLGLSERNARRKIDMVKLSEYVPDLPRKIEAGEISQAKLTQIAQHIRQEERVMDKVFTPKEVQSLVEEVQVQKTENDTRKLLKEKSEIVLKPFVETVKYVGKGRRVIEMEYDDEFEDLLKKFSDVTSHDGYRTKAEVVKKSLREAIGKKHPAHQKTRAGAQARAGISSQQKEYKSKTYIPEWLRQEVWKKCKSMCTYVNPETGERCCSTFRLQIQHIIARAHGGKTELGNLTLYCQSHNLYDAQQLGLLSMSSKFAKIGEPAKPTN